MGLAFGAGSAIAHQAIGGMFGGHGAGMGAGGGGGMMPMEGSGGQEMTGGSAYPQSFAEENKLLSPEQVQ